MNQPVRILLLESDGLQAQLILDAIGQGNLECAVHQTRSEADMLGELAQARPDAIVCGLAMQPWGGPAALALAHAQCPEVPFIFIAAADAEGAAVETLQQGAADYLLSDRLARLPEALRRAIERAQARAVRREAEDRTREAELRFQATFAQAAVGIAHVDAAGCMIRANPRLAGMLGYAAEEMVGKRLVQLAHQADMGATGAFRVDLRAGLIDTFTMDKRFLHKDGQTVWMRVTVSQMLAADGLSLDDIMVFEDITGRMREAQVLALEHTVARCLADADHAGGTLKTIMCAICKSEGWALGCYFCLDEAAGLMHFDQFWRKESAENGQVIPGSRGPSFALGEGLVGRVWQTGEPLWVDDAGADPRMVLGAELRAAGLHAGLALPVRAGGKTVGVLSFWSREIDAPDQRLLQAVRVIGGQVGQFMVRQAQQRQIARLNRIHVVLSGINSLIVRVRDREELFREACRIAVEDGRFSLAWVGIVDRAAKLIRIAACRDTTEGYLEQIPLGLDESDANGRGVAAAVVAAGTAIIVNNIAFSSLHLKDEALARGFCSMMVLPLRDTKGVIGILALYADTVHFFDQEEVKLLKELADDISFAVDHLERADKINYLAYYDALTGLANRALFIERVAHRIATAQAQGQRVAVMVVDIDRFKLINESLGRAAGDLLLQQIAGRFPQSSADQARYARIGADQFAVVMPGFDSEQALGQRIQARMEEPAGPRFKVGDIELRIAARIGVAVYPDDGADAETLIANATSALKRAKASGEKFLFYRVQMSDRMVGRLTLENQLRMALEREEFELHYQPKMDLATRQIGAVEALIRWNSPELGMVPPLQFIPLMEQTGLILEVGAWALRQAARDYRTMVRSGAPALRIAVNVSPIQLRRHNFVDIVRQSIAGGDGPSGIDLEITESLMMEDIDGNIDKLKAIRALGLNIAIDDFGTGYSSLGYLARLPADTLKIDRSFIVSMLEEASSLTLVSTIILLAGSLKLKVVAEGVENAAQEEMLASLNCDQIQGYLISPPLTLTQTMAFAGQWSRDHAGQGRRVAAG